MRIQKPEQPKLLEEMIDHEEKTGSYRKTMRPDDPPIYWIMADLFSREKSKEVLSAFEKLHNASEKYGYKDGGDIVKECMMAKSVDDYYNIGKGSRENTALEA